MLYDLFCLQAGPPYTTDVWPEEVRAWFSSFLAEKERFHLSIVVAGAASCPLYVVELYYDPRPALLGQHLVNMEVWVIAENLWNDLICKKLRK